MERVETYRSWRDKLLAELSKQICRPCTDERKKYGTLDYDNPLNCDCQCERVGKILKSVRIIDENLKTY